jgi:hypothetical protein
MDLIRYRALEREREPRLVLDTSYQQQQSAPSPKKNSKNFAYDYKNDLLVAISPLVLILLIFGGRLAVLVLCFGGLIGYIFDLLGSMEVCVFRPQNQKRMFC